MIISIIQIISTTDDFLMTAYGRGHGIPTSPSSDFPLTGNEAGHIWVNDRANDNGPYPAISKLTSQRMNFADWYDEWLTGSIESMKH